MRNIERLLKEFCPDEIEYKKILDVTKYEQPTKYIVKNTNYNDDYDIPVLTAGQTFILGYTDEINGIYEASKENPVVIFDDFTGSFKWVDFSFKVKSSALKFITAKEDKINLRYLYHIMGNIAFTSDEHKRLWIGKYSHFEIPVPPLEVQEEIVRILDSFTELTARKKQYEYYRDYLLTFDDDAHSLASDVESINTKDVRYFKLLDIAEIGTGSHNTKEGLCEGKYPFFVRSQEIKYLNSYDYDEIAIITSGDGVGVGKIFHYVDGKYALHQRAYRIHIINKHVDPKYLYYYMKSTFFDYITKNAVNSSVTSVRRPMLEKYCVPIPPIETQNKIVAMLDRFDNLCNDLSAGLPAEIEARKKQYEYYRDKLLTFKEV